MKYAFKNEAEVASIKIYDEIASDGWGISVKDIDEQIKDLGDKPLDIHINSYGGEVFEGFAIYNTLKDYKGYKTVYIDGIAASIASVIAMCGDKIVMSKASMLMIHNASGFAYGNAEEMQKVVNALEQINSVIRGIYVAKTGMSEDEIKNLMDNETYLQPQECLEYGFIDEIKEESESSDEETTTAINNLMESFENRVNQLRLIKNIGLEAPTQDGVSVVDEEKAFNKKSKMDWLRNGGIF